jgi:hypothetical protein
VTTDEIVAARLSELVTEMSRPTSVAERRAKVDEYFALSSEYPNAAKLVLDRSLARIAEHTDGTASEWLSAITDAVVTMREPAE